MNDKKKKKFFLNKILQNSKFLFFISLLISLSMWIYMSIGNGNDTVVTISNIPVQIELSDDAIKNGLQIFNTGDITASVSVSGNRAIIGSLTQNDIIVTAATNAIDSSGNYTLSLSASKANPYEDFQIVSNVTPSNVNVLIDYYRESTFDIQDSVVYKVSEGYFASTAISSKSIMITGPQTEVSKIAKVIASATLGNTLTSSTETKAEILLYDSENNLIEDTEMLNMDFTTVDVSISVLPEKSLPIKPVFINKPEGLDISDDMINIEPSSIMLAGTQEVLENLNSVTLESIDFSTLRNERQTFTLAIDIPPDCKNISNASTARVTLDLSSMSSKTLTVERFNVQGLTPNHTAQITQKSIDVTIYGPKEELDKLTKDNITAIIDTSSSSGTVGSVQMPVTFAMPDASRCWANGSYKANLTISEK